MICNLDGYYFCFLAFTTLEITIFAIDTFVLSAFDECH